MATTIKLKNGSGAPLAGDLVAGEPALDLTNKRLYTEDSGGTVIEVGTNPGTDVTFADNRKAIFGAGSDLEIYHNATDSVIADVGTGNLKILANDLRINNADSSKSYITGVNGSYVNLYYNGSQKLVTTNTGIDVTGSVVSDGLTVDTTTLVVDAGNNRVGIGTASPAQQLHLSGTGAIKQRYTRSANSTDISLASNGMFNTDNLAATGFGWYNNGSEAMRIDSSGDVLVNTTTTLTTAALNAGTTGIALRSSNLAVISRDGGAGLIVNRKTSDGDLIDLRKDNTTVGSISNNSSNLQINGTGALELQENGTTRAYVESTGFHPWATNTYDLGTSSARWKDLYLANNISLTNATTASFLQASTNILQFGTSSADPLAIYTNNAERLRIDSSGNVGINNTSPSSYYATDLVVGASGEGGITIASTAATVAGYLMFADGTTGDARYRGYISYGHNTDLLGLRSASDIQFLSGGSTERMRIDSSGNVGIGASSPNAELHIINTTPKVLLQSSGAGTDNTLSFLSRNISNVAAYADIIGLGAGHNSTNAPIVFTQGSGQTERMRIDSSGNLLVGATSASAKLQVDHSSASTPTALFLNQSTASSGVGAVQTSIPSQSNNTNCYHFKGTTQGVASYFLYGNGTSSFTSDERQKKNIVNTRDGYLDDLKRLRVVDYHWNNQEDTEDKSVGLIAQEVEQVFPHLVIEHEMEGVGLRKNLRGSEFTFVLIKAIQEQQAMIETLQAQVAELQGA